jgi:antitoxin (DNA-binding transcriptional repressor) of toxin-antitoxin stability system
MTRVVNVHEAKTHLSRLLAEVENGQEVTIARAGRPVARLSRYVAPKRQLGFDRGRIWISPDFDDPLPDDFLDEFER